MKKIAIVSSFSESCGNAYFTKILMDSMISTGVQVECLSLNLLLTQSINKSVRKKADKHIDNICKSLKDYDGVNIQFEAGLYGTVPADIISRVYKLVSANPNTSVTLHSPRLVNDSASQREVIKQVLKFRLKAAINMYLGELRKNVSTKINVKIIKYLVKNNINLIVHTLRAKEQIEMLFNYTNVHVHPLKIVEENHKTSSEIYEKIKTEYKIDPRCKIVGMFGFVNEYKGHSLAIQTLSYLPSNYKLMIFGRQHPQTTKNNELVSNYIHSLQEKISKDKKIKNRVFFMGEYDNEDFINLAASVDYVWLPYVENGQDGSGIASICMDVSKRVLCSSSFAFDELFRLIPDYNNYARFDIGNYLELASKTLHFMPNKVSSVPDTKYTLKSQAELYIELSTK
ncbi:hypothetical protein EFS38_05295 [Dickeya undicola]|uniref:Glycosyltransferase n=1 Tax=Dickeya undicola TaxID=1577887 RepID=A0ABX9WZJ6_9GAMM|nr:hypothetical protein [Dickeya undicola]RNM25816.1 hypothetical protein EFS38_05295 [Dickeya undicola]